MKSRDYKVRHRLQSLLIEYKRLQKLDLDYKGCIHTTKLGLGLKGHLAHPSHSRQIFDEEKAGVYTEILQGPYHIFSLRNSMQRKAVEAKKYPRCAFSRFLFTCVCLDHQLEKLCSVRFFHYKSL